MLRPSLTFALIFAYFSLYQLWKTCTFVQALSRSLRGDSLLSNVSFLGSRSLFTAPYNSLSIRFCQQEIPSISCETLQPSKLRHLSDVRIYALIHPSQV